MDLEDNTLDEKGGRFFSNIKRSFGRGNNRKVIATLLALLALPVSVILVRTAIKYSSRAASATLSFSPSSATLPPNSTIKLMASSGTTQVGFAMVEVSFDPTKVKLASEVTTSSSLTMNNADAQNDPNYVAPQFACTGTTPCIIKTPMSSANTSGKVMIVLGKDPRVTTAAPSGTFELASLNFTAATTASTTSTITVTQNQLVDMNGTAFTVSAGSANLTLNPAGPTATPTQPPTGGIISNLSVKDTANAADWSIQNNLQNGNLIYGDRTTQTFSNLPSVVLGQQWIRTAMDSKLFTGNPTVTFNVTKNATVYIGHQDAITTKPSWLSTWTDTGLNFNNGTNVVSLFSKNFNSGTLISLGPNGGVEANSMYTVIVREQIGTPSPTVPQPTNTSVPPTNTPVQPSPTGTTSCSGDANGDKKVDGIDYATWWLNFGKTNVSGGPSIGDFDSNFKVDGLDYAIWWLAFGKPCA